MCFIAVAGRLLCAMNARACARAHHDTVLLTYTRGRRYVRARVAAGRPLVFIPARRRKRYANGFLRGELSSARRRDRKERNGEKKKESQGRGAKRREREERRRRGDARDRVEAGRESVPPVRSRRGIARIIFTEIKSKIRLALKCALDRVSRPNRRWLKRAEPGFSVPGSKERTGEEDPWSDARIPTTTNEEKSAPRDGRRRKTDRGRYGGREKLRGV